MAVENFEDAYIVWTKVLFKATKLTEFVPLLFCMFLFSILKDFCILYVLKLTVYFVYSNSLVCNLHAVL